MKTKESRRELKKQNRTVHAVHYYTDDGQEIAFYLDDGKGERLSKTLYFNSDMMAVSCNDPRSKNMTCIQRAKPECQADFKEVERRHPGILQLEFTDAW